MRHFYLLQSVNDDEALLKDSRGLRLVVPAVTYICNTRTALSTLRSIVIRNERGQPLGRYEQVAASDEFRNFVPINVTYIQPESDPSLRRDVGGKKKFAWLGAG